MSLTASNLTFRFPKSPFLFNNLSLNLGKNQIVGLFGINGAGKTTLLKLLSGLLFPTSGRCTVEDQDGHTLSVHDRQPSTLSDIVILPEQFDLPRMTATRYRDIYAPFYPRFDHELLTTLLAELDVTHSIETITLDKLSYGQRKKFLIAFSIATCATYLLLDEPTNGLDIPSKSQFRRVLARDIFQDRCVIISTHQVRDLGQSIDHLLILHNHSIVLSESMDTLTQIFRMTRDIPASFGQTPSDQAPDSEFLYTEPILGGQMILTARPCGSFSFRGDADAPLPGDENTDVRESADSWERAEPFDAEPFDAEPFDMEFFFNAVVSNTEAIRSVLQHHALQHDELQHRE